MKTSTLLKTAFTLSLLLTLFSCSKSNDNPAYTTTTANPKLYEVDYKISPMDNNILQVSYADSSGDMVTVTDLSGFKSGSFKVLASAKPFQARIWFNAVNLTDQASTYTVSIWIDGKLKQTLNCKLPAQDDDFESGTEFDVQ